MTSTAKDLGYSDMGTGAGGLVCLPGWCGPADDN